MILALGLLLFLFAALPVRGSRDTWIGAALVALLALGGLVFVYAVPEPGSRDTHASAAHARAR